VNEQLFDELLESIREGGQILRGQTGSSREFRIPDPDVSAIREMYGLSQQQFAAMLGISVRTLQNWEQGRRKPHGPARVLLQVAAEHPEAILDTIRKAG
jgi:putative transcriptional regulator